METNRAIHSLWSMPGAGTDFIVQLVDITPADGISDLVAALEDMYYGDLTLGPQDPPPPPESGGCVARTHQMVVFSEPGERELTDDEIQRLIYRADMPARGEYSSIRRPDELNRRPGRGAALGPFVTVLWGQQDYIENCAFLSVVVGTAAVSVIADARHRLLAEIAALGRELGEQSTTERAVASVQQTRLRLEAVNRVIAGTENRIALCIDGLSTMMPYIPALRVESYHRALFEAFDTEGNRSALERLLVRLNELVRLEQDALDSRMTIQSEARSKRWSLSIGIASTLTIPFGIIFGFFGIGAAEIDASQSMFATRYLPLFAIVAGLMFAIIALHYILYRVHRSRDAAQRRPIRPGAPVSRAPRARLTHSKSITSDPVGSKPVSMREASPEKPSITAGSLSHTESVADISGHSAPLSGPFDGEEPPDDDAPNRHPHHSTPVEREDSEQRTQRIHKKSH
ncbi:hypothetical protein [Ornithinimicrobium cryptoxanthini]|uniref:Mg2+ and Co2+ transporter CorA n=1 Tax=Ornithinimicrobium cryptoxanthini TaxID=2934161 RepID=A0ABY4YGL1_9MICO|nr:hypothetical protein [Ornithinimicrobium cryptoxanthini]USQ75675.1 hypothetical protein NF557_13795 [Ornithinimicrobium cryptoxanthini]